jgi:filamentous hemagglutinin
VIQALGELAFTARNIFNSFGTLQGGTVNLAATETLRNTSGLVQGGDVSITAGRDIINDTASTAFSQSETTRPTFAFRGPVSGVPGASLFGPSTSTQTTSETVGRRGAIEATGGLAMQAGNDIGIEGGDVQAGGDIAMKAGGDALISAQNLESHSTGKTGSAKSGYDTRTGKSSTVAAGGSVDIAAGGKSWSMAARWRPGRTRRSRRAKVFPSWPRPRGMTTASSKRARAVCSAHRGRSRSSPPVRFLSSRP